MQEIKTTETTKTTENAEITAITANTTAAAAAITATVTAIAIVDVLNGRDSAAVGARVKVHGWVKTRRDSKAGFSFIALSDGSCFQSLQVIAAKELANYSAEILRITTGCSLEVIGTVVASPAKGQAVELRAEQITLVGGVDDPETYPITPKYHTPEYLREFAHLRVRTNLVAATTRVRHCLAQAVHRFFHERGFYWIHTPIITSSDCEGAGQMFRVTTLDIANPPRIIAGAGEVAEKSVDHAVDRADGIKNCSNHSSNSNNAQLARFGAIDFSQDFFGRETFLTVSGQLNVEAYCMALSKVYTFGPTFRAENSNTSRHLAEFWMIEPEVAFADLNDIAALAIDMLRHLTAAVLKERSDDMAFFAEHVDKQCITRLEAMVASKVVYMNYSDAIVELQKVAKKFSYPVYWGVDLQSEHERYLTEELIRAPIVLMNYPKEIKSFYMRVNEDKKTVAAMDVLVPGIGEIIGGSQREERYDTLSKRMDELGMNKNLYKWYLDLRRYGTAPHGGFGLGFERLITYVTGLGNIRDVIPFPRAAKQADF